MNMRADRQEAMPKTRLPDLVASLHETLRQIRRIAGDDVDFVEHMPSGSLYAIGELRRELDQIARLQRQHAAERAAILDALPAQICLLGADGEIVAVNDAWRQFGLENDLDDPEFLLGRNYVEACDRAAAEGSPLAAEAAEGIRAILAGERRRFTLEYACHSPLHDRWHLMSVAPIDPSLTGGAVVMHVDVSDRYRAHARGDELRRRFERLVDQARVGILVHRNFVPLMANGELARMLGYDDPSEVLALEDGLQLYADDEHERLAGFNAMRMRGENAPGVYQVKGKRRDGGLIEMENRAFTIEWGGQMAVCAMLTDITERLETAEQLRRTQRLEAIGQLTGGVAHDFNNLLTIILGNTETLAESLEDDPELRALAEMSMKAAERGAELTSRLLTVSRRQFLDARATDVNRLVSELNVLLHRTLGEHIEIRTALDPGLWLALVDAGQLENAILNLCLNARDAMEGGGRLSVETANVEIDAASAGRDAELEPGQYVAVVVSDTGKGMDRATLDRAFEPFYTTKEMGKGSGLGLSTVYGFAKQSGGHIQLDSEPGSGTKATLYLPRAASALIEKN